MAADPQDDLANLELLRSRLQDNIDKLQKALNHWQTWDFEYEALKEEFQALKDPSQEAILNVSNTFGGDLVDQAEIKELSGASKGIQRSPSQIADVITRRQDYVRKNVETVSKQLDGAQEKLKSLLGVKQEFEDEGGLPIMDIVEELDEDGNVISGSVAAPSQAATKIIEALDKAGVDVESENVAQTAKPASTNLDVAEVSVANPEDEEEELDPAISASPRVSGSSASRKKSVTFAEDTKQEAPEIPSSSTSNPAKRKLDTDIAKGFFTTDANGPSRIIELDDDDLPIGSMPIQPQIDTPEEAELRRQMLQYSMQEVGAVVAELDLEENDDSDYDDYDDDDDEFEDEELEAIDSDFEEDEDEYGRSLRPGISDAYREKMMALEEKLNARMMENVGPRPESEAMDDTKENNLTQSAHRIVVRKETNDDNLKNDSTKKGVRFAEALDISEGSKNVNVPESKPAKKTTPATFSDAVLERQAPQTDAAQKAPEAPKPKKVSRFKSERGATVQSSENTRPNNSVKDKIEFPVTAPDQPRHRPTPTGPEGQILSSSVIERDSVGSAGAGPDELEPELLRREAEAEYHKMRNRMIQKQGGFLAKDDEDDELGDIVEEKEDGSIKPVSRFRAARLKAAGT